MGQHLGRIEKLSDGRAVLHYPGYEPRTYASVRVAETRRQRIEIGTATHKTASPAWTSEEDEVIRSFWGRLPKLEYERLLPGRTYAAMKSRCKVLKVRADPVYKTRSGRRLVQVVRDRASAHWTDEQLQIVMSNPDHMVGELLEGQKRPRQVTGLLQRLALGERPFESSWSEPEIGLVRTIERATQTLREKYGRTDHAIAKRRQVVRQGDFRMAEAVSAVKSATEHLSREVRDEVAAEVLVGVLARRVAIGDLASAVRKAAALVYGPRHYSLDAPIGDEAGITWIDTVESTREHF